MTDKCCPRADVVSTHWEGCHTIHPECAAWRAGREAGLREAAEICTAIAKRSVGNTQADGSRNVYVYEQGIGAERCEVAILSAIGEGK